MNTKSLVELFREFNRKERYWLVRHALGLKSTHLDDSFRSALQSALIASGKDGQIPKDADWAIDYHIDWLVALMRLHGLEASSVTEQRFSNEPAEIKGSQEDFDLVVAFENTLILVEAKGVGCWSNDQLKSKVDRLNALTQAGLIDGNGRTKSNAQLYLVLCSPLQSEGITGVKNWPSWAKGPDEKPIWMCLKPPYKRTKFLAVTRYNDKKCWKVVTQSVRLDCNSGDNETDTALTNSPEPS